MDAMIRRAGAVPLTLLVAAMAGLLFYWRSSDADDTSPDDSKSGIRAAKDPSTSEDHSVEALPSKSGPRSPSAVASKSGTQALLETPIPGFVEFPEQTLAERVAAINRWLEKAGVPHEQLLIAVESSTAAVPESSGLLLESFTVENAPPAKVLQYTTGRTKLYFIVHAGIVEFAYVTLHSPRPSPPPPGSVKPPPEASHSGNPTSPKSPSDTTIENEGDSCSHAHDRFSSIHDFTAPTLAPRE